MELSYSCTQPLEVPDTAFEGPVAKLTVIAERTSDGWDVKALTSHTQEPDVIGHIITAPTDYLDLLEAATRAWMNETLVPKRWRGLLQPQPRKPGKSTANQIRMTCYIGKPD